MNSLRHVLTVPTQRALTAPRAAESLLATLKPAVGGSRDYSIYCKPSFPGSRTPAPTFNQKIVMNDAVHVMKAQVPHVSSANFAGRESMGARPALGQARTSETIGAMRLQGTAGRDMTALDVTSARGTMQVLGDTERTTVADITRFEANSGMVIHVGKMSEEGYKARLAFAGQWLDKHPEYRMAEGTNCQLYIRDEVCHLVDKGYIQARNPEVLAEFRTLQVGGMKDGKHVGIAGGAFAEHVRSLDLCVPGDTAGLPPHLRESTTVVSPDRDFTAVVPPYEDPPAR